MLFVDYLSKLKRDRVFKKFEKAAKRTEEKRRSLRRHAELDPGIHVFLLATGGERRWMGGTSPAMMDTSRQAKAHSHCMSLRLIFMGTPDFAVPTLLDLVAHGHEVVAVYTRAPKPGGGAG